MSNYLSTQEKHDGYYAILKKDNKGLGFDPSKFDNNLKKAKDNNEKFYTSFQIYLKQFIEWERSKEKKFISSYANNKILDDNIKNQILGFISSNNTSAAFQLIEQDRQIKANKLQSFIKDYNSFTKHISAYNNKFFYDMASEAIQKLPLNTLLNFTPEQLVNYLIQYMQDAWENTYNINQYPEYTKFKQTYFGVLKDLLINWSKWRGQDQTKIQDLKIATKTDISGLKTNISAALVDGLVNGLSKEEYQVAIGEGVSTARAKSTLKHFGTDKEQLVPMDTDIFVVLNYELNINQNMQNLIDAAETDKEIKKSLNKHLTDNDFVIHYSVKDMTRSKSSSSPLKIKGEAGLGSKINMLKDVGDALNAKKQIDDLIFSMVNCGKDLIYGGDDSFVNEIIQSLSSLAVGFMFEDFTDELQYMKNNVKTYNALHIYFINDSYYTLSDILSMLNSQIENLKKTVVKISFKPTTKSVHDYYTQYIQHNSNLIGIERWNTVRQFVLGESKLSVRLKYRQLSQLMDELRP